MNILLPTELYIDLTASFYMLSALFVWFFVHMNKLHTIVRMDQIHTEFIIYI